MTFQVFAKDNCVLCQKAQSVLTRLGIEPVVRYVDGPKATADNVADFAWYDWVDKMPLVIVTDGDEAVQRWDGSKVEGRWMPEVKNWLSTHTTAAASPEVS